MRGNSTVWKVATSAHLILAAMLMLMLVLRGPIICVRLAGADLLREKIYRWLACDKPDETMCAQEIVVG
jgi:hypothetical protein